MSVGLAIFLSGIIGVLTLTCLAGFLVEIMGVTLPKFWDAVALIAYLLLGLAIPVGLLLHVWSFV